MSPGRAEQDRLGRICLPIAAFVLPLVLYLPTWRRDIFWLDTTESMLSGVYLRLPHLPGYPLLILLLRLVSLVPILGTPFRMNMVAALGAAGSCLFVYLSVQSLTGRRGAALFAALTWGLSFELWQQATALEVHSFQALIISAVLFCLADWSRTTSRLSFVIGAGFAWLYRRNRMVAAGAGILLLALPLLVFFARQDRSHLHGLAELGRCALAELPADAFLFTDDFSAFQAMRGSSRSAESGPMYGS